MGEGRGAGKRQLKRLFQQKPAKYHKVVSIAELGLHDCRRAQDGRIHEVRVVWFSGRGGRVVVLQLLLPEGVDEVGFCVVGRGFYEGGLFLGFAEFGVAFAEGVEPFFFGGGGYEGVDVYGSGERSISYGVLFGICALEGISYFLVLGSRETIVKAQLMRTLGLKLAWILFYY